ncbi:MAG: hypothetical protein J0H68_07680 [Sphingobacteriia bacterium]|nr:hypothetical protein [Sphingobacteriia bacterium]
MVGIITNTTAIGVQASLRKANLETSSSAMKLSTGEKIIKASDGASDLAIGTSLKGNVITLNAAWMNTQQANSLLGVADGALKNITEILQRQKALATQATSGTLDAVTRGYLDLEFQNLSSEIDRIADTTNFNGIKLLDGSLFSPSELTTYARTNSTAVQGVIKFANAADITAAGTLSINGVTITFAAAASADPRTILNTDTNDATTTAGLVYSAIQNIINSLDPARADDKLRLSGLEFELSTDTITVTSKASGTAYNAAGANVIAITGAGITAADVTVNGTNAGAATVNLSAGGVAGTNGDLMAGSFVANATSFYKGTATTIARGTISDSILNAIDSNGAASGGGFKSGVVTNGISNNPAFVGQLTGFNATYASPDRVNLSITVGDYTYIAKNVETSPAADTVVRLTSMQDGGGYFDIYMADSTASGQSAVTNQTDSDAFSNRLNKAFEGLEFYQKREISSYVGAGSVFPTGGTTQSGNLTGSKFKMFNSDFSDLKIEKIKVEAPVSGGSEALIEITVNGEVFRSGYDEFGITSALGTSMAASTNFGFVSTTDPRKVIVYENGGTAISITNKAEAEGLQKALEVAFGVGQGGTSLSFQVGTKAADNVSVQIQGSKTNELFRDSDGNVVANVSIATLAGANTANTVLDNAISTVTSLRANIGSLQSRFNFAAANVQSSIQNQDAARGVFLDTDVSEESTKFASAQVRLQASISVLAQANQLPQNLLKLIG